MFYDDICKQYLSLLRVWIQIQLILVPFVRNELSINIYVCSIMYEQKEYEKQINDNSIKISDSSNIYLIF